MTKTGRILIYLINVINEHTESKETNFLEAKKTISEERMRDNH